MTPSKAPQDFTETHHALLFGWIAKAVVAEAGEQIGEAVVRKAIRQYGHERGHRMALRAKANGHPLNMANYLAYGEWMYSPGAAQGKMTMVAKKPDAKVRVDRCPWYEAWQANDLTAYARFYCHEIDKALVAGFNPDLYVAVNGTRPDGAEVCKFVFHETNLGFFNNLLQGYKKRFRPGKSAVMPWDYHIGHLFVTLEKVLAKELGEKGHQAVQAGLREFAGRYGEEAVQRVLAFQAVDFSRLPPTAYPGPQG